MFNVNTNLHGSTPTVIDTNTVRILVQTRTHLVRGFSYNDRDTSMLDRICIHHWGRPLRHMPSGLIHWEAYGADCSHYNRRCCFLVEYSHPQSIDNDAPVLRYEFNGNTLSGIRNAKFTSETKLAVKKAVSVSKRSPLPTVQKQRSFRKRLSKPISDNLSGDKKIGMGSVSS